MSDEQMTLFDADEWTSSPEAIPASPSHSPASKKALKTIATSGRQCLSLLSKKDPLLLLAKTLLVTSRWGSTKCFLTWKVKATPQGRLLFQLAPSMPRTEETESGSSPNMWATPTAATAQGTSRPPSPGGVSRDLRQDVRLFPTPTAQDNAQVRGVGKTVGTKRGTTLGGFARMWPTPQAADHKNMDTAGQKMLSSEVKLWPTPRASEWKGTGPLGSKSHNHRLEKGYLDATVQERSQVSGSLNPAWVEWLMGYPEGWTDLNR